MRPGTAKLMAAMASSLSCPPRVTHFTYCLGNALYVPLTSRSNSRTLPELRGDNFVLPASVVAALCRVRDAEAGTSQWAGWCAYLDTQEGPQKLPPALAYVAGLPQGEEEGQPTRDGLFQEIRQQLFENKIQSIVFSGEGEPTLRMDDMLQLSQQVHDEARKCSMSTTVRLTTNGLVALSSCSEALQKCLAHGITHISVGLHTGLAGQYTELVQPCVASEDEDAHKMVCHFIQEAVRLGLQVETTAVDRDDVDKEQTEALSKSLGVSTPVRWRPYFP